MPAALPFSELARKVALACDMTERRADLVKVAALAIVIGVIESMFAKLRLFRVPEMLGAAFILALLALVFFYTLKG